ncbi:MAG TPA: hypothetical protein PLF40_07940 [Kofleriaceae bacterium]|nr:hypothetical protein [Kofleriaceae bacterium]
MLGASLLLLATPGLVVADSSSDTIVVASTPGGKVTLTPLRGGKSVTVPDRTNVEDAYSVANAVPADADFSAGDVPVVVKGVVYRVSAEHVCLAERWPANAQTKSYVFQCNMQQGDYVHHDVWFATGDTRTKLELGVGLVEYPPPPTQARYGMITDDSASYIVDLTNNALTRIERAGAASWDAKGVLFYRTLDGGAWRFVESKSMRLGKGKPGRVGRGSLGDGPSLTEWPAPVTFARNGKPRWR